MAPNSTRLQRILGCKLRRRVTKCPGGVSETPTGFSLGVKEGASESVAKRICSLLYFSAGSTEGFCRVSLLLGGVGAARLVRSAGVLLSMLLRSLERIA